MKIDVFGVGYVGLTLSLVLSKHKHTIKCWDIDRNKIDAYKKCKSDIREPFIDEMLYEFQQNGDLEFEVYNNQKKIDTELAIISIGTSLINQSSKESHENLITLVKDLVNKNVKTILLRSTLEIGTCSKLDKLFGKKCNFIFAPERTIEGKAIEELLKLPQIVACKNEECRNIVEKCFSPLNIDIIFTEIWEEAELAKLVCNVYRDYNFSFSNLLTRITSELDLDTSSLVKLVSSNYERVPKFKPGPVSGPCLSKDSIILSNSISDKSVKSVLKNTRKINQEVIISASEDIQNIAKKLSISKILFIGLTFKNYPFTTDTRNSHSIELIDSLKHQFEVSIFDPFTDKSSRILYNKNLIDNIEENNYKLVVFCNTQKWTIDLYSKIFEYDNSIKYWLYSPPIILDKLSYLLGDNLKLKSL